MYRILLPKTSLYFIVLAALMWCAGVESRKGKVLDIDASTWNMFAVLVDSDRSRIFKHQDIGSILIANHTIDYGFGGGGGGGGGSHDDQPSTGSRNWASRYMSFAGKNLGDALFPKLWLSSSVSTLENISLAIELENAFQIFRSYYLDP